MERLEIINSKKQVKERRRSYAQTHTPIRLIMVLLVLQQKNSQSPGEKVVVKTDENLPTRTKGAESTLFIVTW